MVNCNEYLIFEQLSGHQYAATAIAWLGGVTAYKVKIFGQTNSFIKVVDLTDVALDVRTSFTLPEDGLYTFAVYDQLDNILYSDNVLHLHDIITCYYKMLDVIATPETAEIVAAVCDPCADAISDCDDCGATGPATSAATTSLSRKQARNYINTISPYIFKLMAGIAAERLQHIGLRPVDPGLAARKAFMKAAFEDIKLFTISCGAGLCVGVKANNCDCDC